MIFIIMINSFPYQEFTKLHKFFIPDSVSPSKLIKSINKELKKTEVCNYNNQTFHPQEHNK